MSEFAEPCDCPHRSVRAQSPSIQSLLMAMCFAGLVLLIGSPRALAEPTAKQPLRSATKQASGSTADKTGTMHTTPHAARVTVAIAPLDLKSLPAAAFADWEPKHF